MEPETTPLDTTVESIRYYWRIHIGLERTKGGINNRIKCTERTYAWKRCKAADTLPAKGWPKVTDEDKANAKLECYHLRAIYDETERHDKEIDQMLTTLAKKLPCQSFVASVPNFSLNFLAGIIGHAGNLGDYSSYAKLWKRMGLGLHDGGIQRMRSRDDLDRKITQAEAMEMAYNPERRAWMHVVGDVLIKDSGKRSGVKPYFREVYEQRKQYEADKAEQAGIQVLPADEIAKRNRAKTKAGMKAEQVRKESKRDYMSLKHVDKRAMRYMEKRLLRKLWAAWRAEVRSG